MSLSYDQFSRKINIKPFILIKINYIRDLCDVDSVGCVKFEWLLCR